MKILLLVLSIINLLPSLASPNPGADDGEMYEIRRSWTYKGTKWTWTFEVEKRMYDYYRYERTHLSDDFNRFVFSEYDRQCIKNVVAAFREAGATHGYTDYDNVCNAVCFVQSLDYVTDMDSRGEEEYVRYPVETLVDGEGDCEDVSVLLASILDEMGYGVVLLHFPEHLALGVSCSSSFEGTYFPYNGQRYYYLEATAKNWKIGSIPDIYRKEDAEVIPLVNRPVMHLERCSYHGDSYYLTDREVGFTLTCNYENTGPGLAEDLYLHVLAEQQDRPDAVVLERYYRLGNLREGESNHVEVRLMLPRPLQAMLEFRIEGANVMTETLTAEGVKLR